MVRCAWTPGHAGAVHPAQCRVRPRVDDPGSLAEVRRLRDEILKQRGDKGAPIVVVGSKADLSELEGRQLSVEGHSDAGSVEASVRTGGNRCVRTAATGEVDRAAEPGGVEAQRKYAHAGHLSRKDHH